MEAKWTGVGGYARVVAVHASRTLAAALLAAAVGCRSAPPAQDPFAARTAPPPAAPSGPQRVEQAGFEQPSVPSASRYAPPPGVSILDAAEDEDESVLSSMLADLAPQKLAASFKQAVGLGPDEALARRMYDEGETLFRQADYAEAAQRFETASKRWPDSPLEEDALFMLGECYFFSDRYPKASDTYANLLKKYENSRHLDKVSSRHFAIARYWEELGKSKPMLVPNLTDKTLPYFDTTGNAVAVYKSIQLNDPTGPLADDATMATANAYFVQDRFEDAADHYDLVRKEYPKSEFQPQAHLLGLHSKLGSYQGAQYDAAPLVDGEELVDQMLTQFPAQLALERERLLESRAAIRRERARRDWEAGEYYYKTGYYRAARYYYAGLIEEYPDTPFAQLAHERLDQTKDLPPEPPDRFKWLTNLFPKSKRV